MHQKLLGFNQVWLGCPQPICLTPTIDAMIRLKNGTLLLFRGAYFWQLPTNAPPLVKHAKKIEKEWRGLSAYLDAAYTDRQGDCVFFKDNKVWVFRDENLMTEFSLNAYNVIVDRIDAAVYLIAPQSENDAILLFKDSFYWKIRKHDLTPNRVHMTGNIHVPIDAAVSIKDTIFMFKDWMYYTIESYFFMDNWTSRTFRPKFSMFDIFNCDNDFYKDIGFGSYGNFLLEIATFSREHATSSWISFDVCPVSDDRNETNVLLISKGTEQSETHKSTAVTKHEHGVSTEQRTYKGYGFWIGITFAFLATIVTTVVVINLSGHQQQRKLNEAQTQQSKINEEFRNEMKTVKDSITDLQLNEKAMRAHMTNLEKEQKILGTKYDALNSEREKANVQTTKKRFLCCILSVFT
ncbi:matrix metalloproteinase-14-like isoform X3 [Leptotrombidium deliense]|uniref:Matrix metalloproteinase-14-like isoform X3 n=1 Tax=Leptotrombidium deliense TaxID=299467 RepID=A0A443S9M4_9ACAR|nr:matrix metalloproteinase-14-like isoform X3 [Leptotrombidium deliense]